MSLLPFSKATFANPTGEMDMFGLSDPYAMTEFGGWPTNAGAWNRQIGQHNLQMDVVEMGDSFKVYAGNIFLSILTDFLLTRSLCRCARC